MSELAPFVQKTIQQVMAILQESDTYPRTGRTRPDVGIVKENASVASLLDHTLIRSDATAREIEMLCYEAKEYGFASVCVNSVYIPLAMEMLKETDITMTTVVDVPLGASLPAIKAYQAREAIQQGAREIDVMLHLGALKARDIIALHNDISEVAQVCHEQDDEALCKVIVETSLLTDVEKVMAAQIIRMAGADFVQTSTGFADDSINLKDVELIRQVVGDGVGVKAFGTVSDLADAQALLAAGANRIGTANSVAIAREERQ